MRKFSFIVTLALSAMTAYSKGAYASEELIQIPNSSVSLYEELRPREKALFDFHTNYKLEPNSVCEEILLNGFSYRLSPVPGDNDCGVHSLNAHYPQLQLTRAGILQRLNNVLANPQDPHHDLVRRELANDLVFAIKQILVADYGVSIQGVDPKNFEKQCQARDLGVFLNNNNFIQRLGVDLFADETPFVQEASNNMALLQAHVRYLSNQNVLLLALSQREEMLGTFGLICRLYDVSVSLVNYVSNGVMPVTHFPNSRGEPGKHVLFREDHFSPLCRMNDQEERDRLASHHINNFLLPNYFLYKHANIRAEDRAAMEDLIGKKRPHAVYPLAQALKNISTHLSAEEQKAIPVGTNPAVLADLYESWLMKPGNDGQPTYQAFKMDKPSAALFFYAKWVLKKPNPGRVAFQTSPLLVPADFDGRQYLANYKHVAAEALNDMADPEVYAAAHYLHYRPHIAGLTYKKK